MKIARALILISVILFLFSPATVSAQKLSRLAVGYSSISSSFLPLWIGKETGIFSKNGLDVQMVFFTTGTTSVMALLSGDVQAAILGGPSIIGANRKQVETVVVASFVSRLVMNLYGAKEITSLPQLKGKKIGITRFGMTSDFAARYALKKAKLSPDTDVALIQIGEQATRVAA